MGDYITIQMNDREKHPLVFTVMGYEGMIGSDGLPLSHTLTVQSGASSCLAMAHKISIYDKKSKLTNSMAPIAPQAVADELQWLEIDLASEKDRR